MKVCIDCGCNMPNDHEGDVCECCLDDRGDTIPDGLRREESLYPKICLTTSGPVRETLDKIMERRINKLIESDLDDKPVDWSRFNPFLFRGYGVIREEGKTCGSC